MCILSGERFVTNAAGVCYEGLVLERWGLRVLRREMTNTGEITRPRLAIAPPCAGKTVAALPIRSEEASAAATNRIFCEMCFDGWCGTQLPKSWTGVGTCSRWLSQAESVETALSREHASLRWIE